MIGFVARGAYRLDAWLRQHLGRPYIALLGVGLVYGIIASVFGLSHAMQSGVSVLKLLAMVLFQLALLINQLGQFHEYRQDRRSRREARRRPS
jgi:Zn-dependent protease with chaperone function